MRATAFGGISSSSAFLKKRSISGCVTGENSTWRRTRLEIRRLVAILPLRVSSPINTMGQPHTSPMFRNISRIDMASKSASSTITVFRSLFISSEIIVRHASLLAGLTLQSWKAISRSTIGPVLMFMGEI